VRLKAHISPAKAVCSSAAVNLLKDKNSWHTVCHHALESKPPIIRTPRRLQGNDLSSPDASDRVYAVEPRKQPKNKQNKLDARTSESQVGGPLPSLLPLASEWQSNDGVMGGRRSVWDNTPSLASTARSSPDPVDRSALRNRFGRRKSCPRVRIKSESFLTASDALRAVFVAVGGFRGWKGRGPSAVDSTPPGAAPKYPDPGQQGNDLSESQGDRI